MMKLSVVAVTVVGVMRVVATLMVVGVVILQNVHGIVAGSVVVENPRGFLPMDLSGCLLAWYIREARLKQIRSSEMTSASVHRHTS